MNTLFKFKRCSKVVALLSTCLALPVTATGFHTQNGNTTGGQGGNKVRATSGTAIHQALCSRSSSDTPIIIEVEGTINHGNTSKVSGSSCNTASDKIELKDVSNITLVGVGNGATFDQLGIHMARANNIIIRNVTVKNVKKSGSPTSNGGDAIGIESDTKNVWVDHVTLTAAGGESEGYDGLFDVKGGSQYITLSYSILKGSDRGGLVGSSETQTGNGPITYHHNIFDDLNSRVPLLRWGTAHIYNNLYTGIRSSGINARADGEALVENNYFRDSVNVLGTFYTSTKGYWEVSGNVYDNVTWNSGGSNNPAGPNPSSTTNVSIPYNYSLDDANCLTSLLPSIAGANKGNKNSDGNCSSSGGGSGSGGSAGGGGSQGDFYIMRNRNSNKCMRVKDSSNADNADIIQESCNSSSASQQFTIDDLGNGYFHIRNSASGKCLRASGSNVVQYTCYNNYWTEMFAREYVNDGHYIYRNRHSNSCLRVQNSSGSNGASIVLDSCNANFWSQQFLRIQ
jgi:pectate lyase